jgi:hypothetical protein
MAETSEPLELHHMYREHVYDFDEYQLLIYKHGDRSEVFVQEIGRPQGPKNINIPSERRHRIQL